MRYSDGLRQSDASLDPIAALRAPTAILLGVTDPVRTTLESVGLTTVFDLATSPLFALAYEIGEALQGRGRAALARFDTVPGGASAPDGPSRIAEFGAAPLSALRSLTPTQAASLAAALQVDTVADLGRWLPYRSARLVLDAAGGNSGDAAAGDEASELVPRMGEFPTERHYYSSIVMDRVSVQNPTDLAAAGPVDISPTVDANFGFSAPAVGARLTFEQSWYAHGVTLGNLLHSVALAPGESTRIAVVDWSRRTRASGTETVGETESLVNDTTHNRAVSEVQEAVAHEVQTGFSHTESESTTKSAGGGFGLSIGPITAGGSAAIGKTNTSADSFSTSAGSRDLAASMSQQVMDATHQAASSVRNRRASIVKEISETEHESTSTRILANYNHMHALTVQYYEVVELYRVVVSLHEVERCLFVPMKLVDFDDRVLQRYQGALAAAALDRRAFELLTTDFGMVRVSAVRRMRPFVRDALLGVGVRALARAMTPTVMAAPAPATPGDGTTTPPAPPPPPPQPDPPPPTIPDSWDLDEIRRAARITASPLVRPGSESLLLPREAKLEGISLALDGAAAPVTLIQLKLRSGGGVDLTRTSIGWRVPGDVPLDELHEVLLTTGAGTGRASGAMSLELSYRGAYFPMTIGIDAPAGATTVVARTGESETGAELIEHLRDNRLHYNQAIWRSFDASTVALLLSKFSFEGLPVADLIDPRPIQVAGNYLVFRMPGFVSRAALPLPDDDGSNTPEAVARRGWREWLTGRGLTFGRASTQEQLVPVPTGGVFAEAVLGRSNSAEKLDATRFWNWQDSPIPLQPPEIAAINMASRAQPIDVTPGHLGQPVLNIVNPSSLPDPTGLGAALSALQNGGMFRDMSGLAATIGLATSTAGEATSAANESQRLAAANLAVAAQKDIEEKKIAAQLALAAMGNPAAMAGTPKNHSEMGAMLNTADARDKAKAAGGGGGGGASGSNSGGGGPIDEGGGSSGGTADDGGIFGGGGDGGGSPSNGGGVPSAGDMTFSRAINGLLGDSVARIIPTQSGGGARTAGPAQFVRETCFYAHIVRGPQMDSIAEEVSALDSGIWHPASVDFRAISIRSMNGREPPANHEISTVDDFLRVLGEPVERFNYFGYTNPDGSLSFQGQTSPGGTATEGSTDTTKPESAVFDAATIAALAELGELSNPGGSLGARVKAIRGRNKDFNAQKRGTPDRPELRELWLETVDNPASEQFATSLANALKMKVVIFSDGITFRPQFTVSPPAITLRGRIDMLGQVTTDLHTFDNQGIRLP